MDVGRQRQRAGAAQCLGPARRPPAAGRVGRHGPLDDQGAGRGVEVGPAEAQDLAAPEARERQQPARVQRVARGVLPQGRDVGRAERVPRLGLDARRLHLGRDVADDDPVVERLAEDRSHDEQRERARPLGLARRVQAGHQALDVDPGDLAYGGGAECADGVAQDGAVGVDGPRPDVPGARLQPVGRLAGECLPRCRRRESSPDTRIVIARRPSGRVRSGRLSALSRQGRRGREGSQQPTFWSRFLRVLDVGLDHRQLRLASRLCEVRQDRRGLASPAAHRGGAGYSGLFSGRGPLSWQPRCRWRGHRCSFRAV